MITGWRFARSAGIIFLCIGSLQMAYATGKDHHKKKVQPQLPALPSGPTGPIQPIPLDSMAPVAPRVTYENGQLTIDAANSTLGDILSAVCKQTGAQIEVPDASERVVTHLGPGPAQKIIVELLNGSRFSYVLLWSPQDPSVLTRVVLVARSAQAANTAAPSQPPAAVVQAKPHNATAADDSSTDSNGEVPGQPDQPATAEQPGVMTAQGLLQRNAAAPATASAAAVTGTSGQFSGQGLPVPEIDGATALAAAALVTCAILIIRRRREI